MSSGHRECELLSVPIAGPQNTARFPCSPLGCPDWVAGGLSQSRHSLSASQGSGLTQNREVHSEGLQVDAPVTPKHTHTSLWFICTMSRSNPGSFPAFPSSLLSPPAGEGAAPGSATLGEAVVMHLVCPQLLEAISQGSQSRRQRRQADRLKPYIAAQVDVLPETFTLGDEKNYKGFYNKPLSQDLSYRCFVLASLEDGDTVRASCWGGRHSLS